MHPLHSSALGKVLAAWDPVARSEALESEEWPRYTDATVCGTEEFDEELERTRARGWAADLSGTWEGLASVAAPIRDSHRLTVGAVGVTGAVERLSEGGELRRRLVAAVRDTARSISRDLGADPLRGY